MIFPDVNVLVYVFRRDAERHREYRGWFKQCLLDDVALGYSDLVLSALVRIVTHPRIFHKPSSTDAALGFAEFIRSHANTVAVSPGQRHWLIFANLCRQTGARGNVVPDAYFAALAIEHGPVWSTADRGFARFPDLEWRHPLDG